MMDVRKPLREESLTRKEKLQALWYLTFMKQKRCGCIKTRGGGDGRAMRVYTDKFRSSSPTVVLKSVFLTCGVAAKEKRKKKSYHG